MQDYNFVQVIIDLIFLSIAFGMLFWSLYDYWKWSRGKRKD